MFLINVKVQHPAPVPEDPNGKTLFFILRDPTSKDTTCGGGRFLHEPLPDHGITEAGNLTLDFNRLENPPCAYTNFATCPLPPHQLDGAIEAGEKVTKDRDLHWASYRPIENCSTIPFCWSLQLFSFGGDMNRLWGNRSILCLALAGAFFACTPAHAAPSAKSVEKQAHKVESTLAKFPKGAFLHLFFRDGTNSNGKLGNLSESTFSFTNSDSNADETHAYADVTKIEKGKEYIGEGPGHRHIHIF